MVGREHRPLRGLMAGIVSVAAAAPWCHAQTDNLPAHRVRGDSAASNTGIGPFEILASGPDALVWYDQRSELPWASLSRIGVVEDRRGTMRASGLSEYWPRGVDHSTSGRHLRAALDGRILAQHIGDPGGAELWSLDPASGAWTPIAQTVTGPIGGEPRLLTRAGRYIYFAAHDDTLRERLWRTDGTPAGTRALTVHGTAWSLVPLGASMMAAGYLLDSGEAALWRFDDGDPAAPVAGEALISAWGQFPKSMVAAGSRIEIALSAPLYGTIVWRSDGTAAGTWGIGWVPAMATLLAAGTDEAGTRYLSVYTAGGREELWALSPASGALRLTGSFASISDSAATAAGLVFSAAPATAPPARPMLWSSDGSVAGTHPLVIRAGGTLADAHIWCSDGATAYLTAHDRDSGAELWISDGTSDGTSRLTDLAPGPASSDPHDVTVVTSRIYFGAHDGASPDDLWMIDRRPADFNNDSAVGPQDVLDFLIEYLAGRDRADFNGIDGVSIEDMLAWMVFWFAGRE